MSHTSLWNVTHVIVEWPTRNIIIIEGIGNFTEVTFNVGFFYNAVLKEVQL